MAWQFQASHSHLTASKYEWKKMGEKRGLFSHTPPLSGEKKHFSEIFQQILHLIGLNRIKWLPLSAKERRKINNWYFQSQSCKKGRKQEVSCDFCINKSQIKNIVKICKLGIYIFKYIFLNSRN